MYTRSNSWVVPVLLGILVLVLLLLCGGIYLVGSRVLANPSTPTATPVPVLPTPVPPVATPVSGGPYPLAGQRYTSPQGDKYNAVWTADGRLWQPQLPEGNLRIAHSVGITIEEGNYAFDGVQCRLYLDTQRNGQGSKNPVTAANGNDIRFTVQTADHGQAWALVECDGGFSSGFQIRSLGR